MTELYSTRVKLEESELWLKKAQAVAKLGVWEENHQTGEVYWSPILRKMFEIDVDTLIIDSTFWDLVHPDDIEWMKTIWKEAETNLNPYSGTFRIMLKDGRIKYLKEQAEFIKDSNGNLHKTVGTVIETTELHTFQEELRKLSSHIQRVQEEERGRIAREIHDELGQHLTSIIMDLSFLRSKIGKDTPNEIKECLLARTVQAETTIQIIRKISQELRPSILDDLGLIAAIDWLKEQYHKRTDIRFTFDIPKEEIDINSEYSTAIFRITQEAFTNIMRHADATEVEVNLDLQHSSIFLEIKDNGKGFNKHKTESENKSFGIFGMKERAAMLGGALEIISQPHKGTSISLELPLKSN